MCYIVLYINIYVIFCNVVELCACRGTESWWGGRLACLDGSLARYVIRDVEPGFTIFTNLWLDRLLVARSVLEQLYGSCSGIRESHGEESSR